MVNGKRWGQGKFPDNYDLIKFVPCNNELLLIKCY